MQLPFNNTKYRSTLRIVDYFPDNLEDFAVLCKPPQPGNDSDSDSESDNGDHTQDWLIARESGGKVRQWEWRFGFVVKDGRDLSSQETLKVFVAENDAVFLLGMDAEE